MLKAKPPTVDSFSPDPVAFMSWDMLNAGPAAAEHVTFVFEFPESVNGASGNISTLPCSDFNPSNHQLVCTWPDTVASGTVLTAMVSFSVAGLDPGAAVAVLARVASDTADPDLTNNQSIGTFTVGGAIPATGESSPILIWLAAAASSIGIAAVLIARRRTVELSQRSR